MSLPAVLFWCAVWRLLLLLPRGPRERAADTLLRCVVRTRHDHD